MGPLKMGPVNMGRVNVGLVWSGGRNILVGQSEDVGRSGREAVGKCWSEEEDSDGAFFNGAQLAWLSSPAIWSIPPPPLTQDHYN